MNIQSSTVLNLLFCFGENTHCRFYIEKGAASGAPTNHTFLNSPGFTLASGGFFYF